MKRVPMRLVALFIAGLGLGLVGCKEKPPETPAAATAEEGEKLTAENAKSQLFEAARGGNVEKVKAALKLDGALINSKDGTSGRTPLHEAAANGQKAVITQLLSSKANVNAKDSTGATPLHLLANSENKELVTLLLAAKADINAKDNNGATPLYTAAVNGQRTMVEFLIANKADASIKDKGGLSPFQAAAKAEKQDIAVLLRNQEVLALRAKADAEVDRKKLESQKKRAADGSSTAQFDLGQRYMRGDGVEKDEAQAREWFQKAAANGSSTAEKMLKEMDAKAAAKKDAKADAKEETKSEAKADAKK